MLTDRFGLVERKSNRMQYRHVDDNSTSRPTGPPPIVRLRRGGGWPMTASSARWHCPSSAGRCQARLPHKTDYWLAQEAAGVSSFTRTGGWRQPGRAFIQLVPEERRPTVFPNAARLLHRRLSRRRENCPGAVPKRRTGLGRYPSPPSNILIARQQKCCLQEVDLEYRIRPTCSLYGEAQMRCVTRPASAPPRIGERPLPRR